MDKAISNTAYFMFVKLGRSGDCQYEHPKIKFVRFRRGIDTEKSNFASFMCVKLGRITGDSPYEQGEIKFV